MKFLVSDLIDGETVKLKYDGVHQLEGAVLDKLRKRMVNLGSLINKHAVQPLSGLVFYLETSTFQNGLEATDMKEMIKRFKGEVSSTRKKANYVVVDPRTKANSILGNTISYQAVYHLIGSYGSIKAGRLSKDLSAAYLEESELRSLLRLIVRKAPEEITSEDME